MTDCYYIFILKLIICNILFCIQLLISVLFDISLLKTKFHCYQSLSIIVCDMSDNNHNILVIFNEIMLNISIKNIKIFDLILVLRFNILTP